MKCHPPVHWTTSVFYTSGDHEAVASGELALHFLWTVDFVLLYKKPLKKVSAHLDEKLLQSKAARSLFAHIDKFEIHQLGTHYLDDDYEFWQPESPPEKSISREYCFASQGPEGLSIRYDYWVTFKPTPKHDSAFSFDTEGALHSDFIADLHELTQRSACFCAANPFLTNRIFKAFGGYFPGNKCLGMLVSVMADFYEMSNALDTDSTGEYLASGL